MPVPFARDSETSDELLCEVSDGIAWVTLNRPKRGNSFTVAMFPHFRSLWERIRQDSGIKCVILTGAGDRHFCTGLDITSVAETGRSSEGSGRITDEVVFTSRQNNVWKPVICAVNGLTIGGGLHFVVDSDIVVASKNAAFGDTHVSVGFVGGIENIGLARRLPLGSALRMTLQGKSYRMTADRAYQLGLVDELTEPADLLSTAEAIAKDIVANSPAAVSMSQQAVWSALELPYSQAIEYGWALVRAHKSHPDYVEGPRAFAERRAPVWDHQKDS